MDKEKTGFLKKAMDKLENMRVYRKHIEKQKGILILSSYFNFQIILKAFATGLREKSELRF